MQRSLLLLLLLLLLLFERRRETRSVWTVLAHSIRHREIWHTIAVVCAWRPAAESVSSNDWRWTISRLARAMSQNASRPSLRMCRASGSAALMSSNARAGWQKSHTLTKGQP